MIAGGIAAGVVALVLAGPLAEAQRAFDQLECEAVLPLAAKVLEDPHSSPDDRMTAYQLLGASLAVVGRAAESEQAFRYLLRGRPDFDLPDTTPPKVLRVFRSVKVEEERIRAETAELERRRIVESIGLLEPELGLPVGGLPLELTYGVRDPRGAVHGLRLHYRRAGTTQPYSTLGLERDPQGRWLGVLPADWTENEDGMAMEYWVESVDVDQRALVSAGTERAPRTLAFSPGRVSDQRPFYRTIWFWSAVAAVVAGGAVTTWLVLENAPRYPTTADGAIEVLRLP